MWFFWRNGEFCLSVQYIRTNNSTSLWPFSIVFKQCFYHCKSRPMYPIPLVFFARLRHTTLAAKPPVRDFNLYFPYFMSRTALQFYPSLDLENILQAGFPPMLLLPDLIWQSFSLWKSRGESRFVCSIQSV